MAFVCVLILIGLHISILESADGAIQALEYESVNQSSTPKISDGPKNALDNNTYTFASTEKGYNESWTVTFKQPTLISCFRIFLRGGTYVILVKNYEQEQSVSECSTFTLAGFAKSSKHDGCCTREFIAKELMVIRLDYGALRLYDIFIVGCDKGWFGMNCTKCSDACATCDVATGLCTSCNSSRFGEMCEFKCPQHCSNGSCSFESGECLSCESGYTGPSCTPCKSDSKSNDEDDDMNTLLVALLFTSILLLLLLILFFIKRYRKNETKQHSPSTEQCDNTLDAEAIPLRIPIGNESTTVVLEELDHSEEIPQQQVQFLDVEYTNTIANRISLDNFIKIYDDRRDRNENEADEFTKIPSGLMEIHTQALKTENMSRNRYKHVYPYDFCRVVLDAGNGTKGTDYINACFVEGFGYEKAYIAAQGPFTSDTLEDFWRMIWEYDCTRIVMLTNLYEGEKMKCLKYWPEDEIDFGEFDVKVETQDIYEMYTIRYLSATKNMERKRVTQFHFTGWPDCNVPESVESLLCFRDLVKNGIASSDGPIVVHCSAGIGRTGTFIALDYLLEEGISTDYVDVINCVSKLRQQRAHSIQTKEQYVFLYDALTHGLKTFRRKSLYHVVDEM